MSVYLLLMTCQLFSLMAAYCVNYHFYVNMFSLWNPDKHDGDSPKQYIATDIESSNILPPKEAHGDGEGESKAEYVATKPRRIKTNVETEAERYSFRVQSSACENFLLVVPELILLFFFTSMAVTKIQSPSVFSAFYVIIPLVMMCVIPVAVIPLIGKCATAPQDMERNGSMKAE